MLQALGVGYEQVITHQLHLGSETLGQELPAVPVVLSQAVLDRDDRELLHQLLQLPHHLGTVVAAAIEGIATVLEEFGTGHVECQGDLLTGLVAGFLDRLHQNLTGFHVAQIRSEATLITHGCAHPPGLEQPFEGVEHFGTHAQSFAEALSAVGHQHEFLKVKAVGSVGPTVDHIHQGNRKQVGHRTPQIAIQGDSQAVRSSSSSGHAHREDGIRAEIGFVIASVEIEHGGIDGGLIQ